MPRPVDSLIVDEFCQAADAFMVEALKSHAGSSQSLIRKSIERGATVELRFNPKTEIASLVLVFANGRVTNLFSGQRAM
jgi:hypothetical protein